MELVPLHKQRKSVWLDLGQHPPAAVFFAGVTVRYALLYGTSAVFAPIRILAPAKILKPVLLATLAGNIL